MRKFSAALLALASLTFFAGCGASGGSDAADTTAKPDTEETTTTESTTTTEADTSLAVDEWAEGFCGNFGTWLDEIEAASGDVASQVTPGDLESAKTAISDLFGSASASTVVLIEALEEGGDPDIEDGDQLVDDLIEKFTAFDEAAQQAITDTEALSTDDPTAFQADATELTTRFQDEVNTVADSFAEIDVDYPSEELNDALTSACDF